MSIPIDTAAQAVADADGRAEARLQPGRANVNWNVTRYASSTTSTTETKLRVYKNSETPSGLLDSTYTANNAVSANNDVEIRSGECLIFVWTNATPGAICTVSVFGEMI